MSLAFAVPEALREEFAFQPGQYLTVRATIDGEECRRSYSISSGADEGELRIAVRKVDGGQFSRFANEALAPGARLDVAPPEGRFTAEIGADRHYAFFAAGSGITPVISIIRSMLAANEQRARDARLRQPHDREHHVPPGARRPEGPLSRTARRLPCALARVAGDRPPQRPDRRRTDRAPRKNHRPAGGRRRLFPVRAVRHDRGRRARR